MGTWGQFVLKINKIFSKRVLGSAPAMDFAIHRITSNLYPVMLTCVIWECALSDFGGPCFRFFGEVFDIVETIIIWLRLLL